MVNNNTPSTITTPNTHNTCSRLCIKHLPLNLSLKKFKSVFNEIGQVTDAKIMKTKDGRSRQFGFIGFKNCEDAKRAKEYFNNTFIGASKIFVEYAENVGIQQSSKKIRPQSKYSVGSRQHKHMNPDHKFYTSSDKKEDVDLKSLKNSKANEGLVTQIEKSKERIKNDKKLQEFLRIMKPRSEMKAWENDWDELESTNVEQENGENVIDTSGNENSADDNSSEHNDDDDTKLSSLENQTNDSLDVCNDKTDDLDYFRSKSNIENKYIKDETRHRTESDNENQNEDQESLKFTNKEGKFDDRRIFVRNLPFCATTEEVENLVSSFGNVEEVHIPLDDLKRSKGFCFIKFESPESASRALKELDMEEFQGRLLHVLPAKRLPNDNSPNIENEFLFNELDDDALNSLSYKKKLDINRRRKSEFKNDIKTQNSLFLRSDTVNAAVAKKLGITKSELLNSEGDESMAVKVAMCETQTIDEIKTFLKENDFNIDVFNQRKDKAIRSKNVILVKNLPFSTTFEELVELFEKYGTLGRVLLPPSNAIAVIEYITNSEAKNAFRNLAYRKFKTVPLYLEQAPESSFLTSTNTYLEKQEKKSDESLYNKNAQDKALNEKINNSNLTTSSKFLNGKLSQLVKTKKSSENYVKEELNVDDDNENDNNSATLFVKNLNFETNESTLKKIFSVIGKLKSVTIKTRLNPAFTTNSVSSKENNKSLSKSKNSVIKQHLSMGYGFVEYYKLEDANTALSQLQGVLVDNHKLELKISDRKSLLGKPKGQNTKEKNGRFSNTKIVVKNLAFEANSKELRQLFGSYGEIKSCRLPSKIKGHRGFAFIEFVSKQEALNAFEALSNTHLYGRHLILQQAKKDDEIEELRMKTARKYKQLSNTKQNFEDHYDFNDEGDFKKRRKVSFQNSKDRFGSDDDYTCNL